MKKRNKQKKRKRKTKNTRKVKQQQYTPLKLCFAEKHSLRKSCLYLYIMKFCLQFLCVAGYLKDSNDTPKLNMHKYISYNIIEIYINRLSTTTQIFITMDYLMMVSEKCFHFRKRRKHFGRDILSPPRRSNWIHELWKYYSNYVLL